MLSSLGLGIFTVSGAHCGTKKFNTTDHAKSLYFVTKRRKNAILCVPLVKLGLKILRVRHRKATWRLEPTSRTRNFKTEAAVRMKLGRLVVLLAVYLKLQTNSEYTFPWPRYTWLNMTFYAYLPDMVFNVKGMMTLTYDLDLLQGYLGPKTKIRATNINMLRP